MAFVRHLQVTLQSATFSDPLSNSLDERMVYVKASHKNIVYTTNVVEGVGNVELHYMWGNDGTNVFHFAYEDDSEDIALELFNRDHICIGISRLLLAGLAKVMPEQDPELKILPVSALDRLRTYGSLALTAQIKRQQAMGKLGNLNVVLQEGIINSISSTESRVFAKLIYKHTTYTIGILRGERNKFVWLEHFTFRINSWEPVDVLEICIYSGAFQVGECKVLLSLFINLEENLQADRKDLVIRTEDLLMDKRSVGSIKVAGSFSTLHELDVLRAIVKEKGPESHSARIPPLELPGMPNYASIINDIRGEGEIEADIFHTDKSKSKVQLEFKEIWNAGKPTSIGDYLPIDLARDLLGASSRGYVIRASCPDGQGGRYPCALKRIDTMDESEPDLARLCHLHVVHLFHYWKKRIDNGEVHEWMPEPAFMTFLMMELMDGDLGNFLTSIKTTGLTAFSLLVVVDVMLQIAKGMLYLHEMGVSHPHLKCSNVLCRVKSTAQIPFRVGDVLVKLGGFGCSRAANDDTKKRDVLCFGLTCLEILTGDQCFEDIYGGDKVSRPNIPETTPCILRDCIASCLDTKITFSEAITLLLLAQSQIIQTCGEDKMILCNDNLHIKSTLSNNQDKASSSTSKADRQEMFHVHQLHPQLGEVATSVQITLIFFHGFPKFSEEWRMTWLTRDSRLVWPQMWLPEDLDGDIRVLSVSFDDRPDVSSSQSIKDLLQLLVMSATCKLGDTDQAIVLVGHSFGGVIIKALVAAAQGLAGKTVGNEVEFQEVLEYENFLKRLASIVFYSVPHAFANMEFENYISGCSNTRVLQRSFLLKALRRDGVFISDMVQLSRDFENAVPRKTKLLAFLEGKPMSRKSLLVTENSGEGLSLSWEWHKIDRDNHFEVCRPVSKSHIGYKVLLNHLQQHMCSPSAVNVRRVWKVIGTVLICICKFKEVLSRYRKLKCSSLTKEIEDPVAGRLGKERRVWKVIGTVLICICKFKEVLSRYRKLKYSSLTKEIEDSVAGRLGKRHNPMGIFTSPGYLKYDSVDGPTQSSMSANFHSSSGSSGITDHAATSGASRQFFGFLTDNMQDDVKKEEGSDGHARIDLNLGVRSYFSTEDSTAGGPGMRHRKCSPGSQVPICQAEGCKADLSTAKNYHRRHEVCECHSKAPSVIVGGHTQRFCQQCSRFHHVGEFDEGKRSCRKRLADHSRRRLKQQLNASNLKGPPAESIGIKAGKTGDPYSDPEAFLNMCLQKNWGSPSSVSLEDSDEEPGSPSSVCLDDEEPGSPSSVCLEDEEPKTPGVGNLQLRTAGPGFDSRVLTSALEDAEKVIMHWDMDYATSHRWVFESTEEDARTYLNAVDKILTELESLKIHNRDPKLLEEAHLLQLAMKRLEEELRHVLERYTGFLDPDVFMDSFSAKSCRGEEEDEEDEDEREEEEEEDKEDGDEEKLQVRKLERTQSKAVALLPAQAAEDVLAIVTRLIAGGFKNECVQVYTSSRKIVLERSLEALGVERMSIEEVQKMPWELQVEKIRKWNQAMKVGVSVLFASEKKLCDMVFAPPLADICFNEFANSKMLHLLSFGNAIALSCRSPEKLFKVLDMYDTLFFLIPDIELTFSGTSGTSVRSSASDVLSHLGEAARATFTEFELAIRCDKSHVPVTDESVHPLTRYVMTYIKFAGDYTDTLELAYGETTQTLTRTPALTSPSPRSHHSNSPDDRSMREGASLLANQIRRVAQVLQANLEFKARRYEDRALAQVFLMNNIHYMVQEVKSSEVLFSFFGDTWEKEQAGVVRKAAYYYQRAAWSKALLRLSGSASSCHVRLNQFNTIFDEAHRTQSQWVVLDPMLRDELRISIAEEVVPAYRVFLEECAHVIGGLHRIENMKYSVEGLEMAIREFFMSSNSQEKAADSSKLASGIEDSKWNR